MTEKPFVRDTHATDSTKEVKPSSQVVDESNAVSDPASAMGQPTYVLETGELGTRDGFARITVDVPMTLGSRGGAPIGFLRKGTRVKVVSVPEAGTVTLAAPFPAVNRYGGVRVPRDEANYSSPLYVSIDVKISPELLKKRDKLQQQENASDVRYGLYREIAVSLTGPGYAFAKCGRIRVIERKDTRLRVVAEYDAGELYGWVDAAGADERDEGCNWSNTPALPHGYSRVEPEADRKLVQLATEKAELFWGPRKGEFAKCERWVFAPGKDPMAGWLVLDDGGGVDTSGTSTERSYGIHDGILSLGGLVYRQKEAAVVAGGKVDFFAVVRAKPELLDVLEWEPQNGQTEHSLLGYRSTSAKSWYMSRSACEASLSKSATGKGAAKLQSGLGK